MARKTIVKTAEFWFNAAKTKTDRTAEDRVMAMEQAFNHTENALAAALDVVRLAARGDSENAKARAKRFLEIGGLSIDE